MSCKTGSYCYRGRGELIRILLALLQIDKILGVFTLLKPGWTPIHFNGVCAKEDVGWLYLSNFKENWKFKES